ncbi:MAG TPA: FHA domain-containing protein, partial [Rhodopila sp.]|nr:FHA domain-containing protein [Rhodopila sp.]
EILAPAAFAQRMDVRPPFTIGRATPSEVVLARSDVSRMHCRIDLEGGRVMVADLNSTNGTFVNDHRIAAPTPLNPGDRLKVGSFVLRYDTDAAASEPTQRGPAPDFLP